MVAGEELSKLIEIIFFVSFHAQLYRKDLISAMKLADSEPLTPEEYWLITDPWKQEWEKGVQVPVNPESLPEPEVVVISPVAERSHDFRL